MVRITPADAGKTVASASSGTERKDHPRGCGENTLARAKMLEIAGSPPRMRGKRHPEWHIHGDAGITPADAGKTYPAACGFVYVEDHPRGCGENLDNFPLSNITQGSPPRMRGKHAFQFHAVFGAGITPADAGKTGRGYPCPRSAEDHPRGCGENTKKIL